MTSVDGEKQLKQLTLTLHTKYTLLAYIKMALVFKIPTNNNCLSLFSVFLFYFMPLSNLYAKDLFYLLSRGS